MKKSKIPKDFKKEDVIEFLSESNKIEREYGPEALEDAIRAWTYLLHNENKFSIKTVKEVHGVLMERLRPDIAGKFRQCDVYIGGDCRRYISDALLAQPLKDLIKRYNVSEWHRYPNSSQEAFVKDWHIAFEEAHVFQDGNGRVGRLLMNMQRLRLGLPIHIIHEGYEQWCYYQWFKPDLKNPFDKIT